MDALIIAAPPTEPKAKAAFGYAQWACWGLALCLAIKHSYLIRIKAIETFGYVIHEFDPWFNYRATVYLADHGLYEFFHWFDRMSWYPLGRPVGTTIYPGMQVTSVALWKALGWAHSKGLLFFWAHVQKKGVLLNDVCCLVPAWFGGSATVFLGLLTLETTGSYAASACGALVMSVIPAHLMRSVGGGYDNESVAMTAMCATFYFWCRSLRPAAPGGRASAGTWGFGVLAGLAYFYMVAAWGGFTFVVNCVACHAFCLAIIGRYTPRLRVAYSLFFVIGTLGAMQVPVIGLRPIKDMELMPPLLVFLGLHVQARAYAYSKARGHDLAKTLATLAAHGAALVAALVAVALVLYPRGFFGPPSSRVRSLFVKFTRTGNPLVDSVAEHQPASQQAYTQYLHNAYDLVPWGLGLSVLHVSDATLLIWIYAGIAYHFANKMARLIILIGPIASVLSGAALGAAADHLFLFPLGSLLQRLKPAAEEAAAAEPPRKGKKRAEPKPPTPNDVKAARAIAGAYRHPASCLVRMAVFCYYAKTLALPKALEFRAYCEELSEGLSQPSIMFKARLRNGEEIIVDDYREAYWWLRDSTPKDARILSWWDYGYQITGIGERTTLADGNTWNHEHIATLGRILTSPEAEAHKVAKHLADYVLIWAGGGGDDLAKSPHMARIGNSVYHHFCPDDPTCRHFGFYQGGRPSPSMAKSLLYVLSTHGQQGGAKLNRTRWEPVFTSKFGKVRIFRIKKVSQKSKAWAANASNWVCDAPGSWYCPGQYPPAIKWLIDQRKPFRQLEDFNRGADAAADKYTEQYHKKMAGGGDDAPPGEKKTTVNLAYVGCYRLEASLPREKVYGGGGAGARVNEAAAFALQERKRYFAVARVGQDGHAFAFDQLPADAPGPNDAGCARPCDDEAKFVCGCADAGCDVVPRQEDEEYVRRWVVYDTQAGKPPKKKALPKSEL